MYKFAYASGVCQRKKNIQIPVPVIYTQIIRTHNSHRHTTTTPLQTLVQAPTHSPPALPTPPQPKHTSNTPPCSHRIGKTQTQSLIHSPPFSTTPPRPKHIHISHTPPTPLIPRTTLIQSTSAALDTIHEPRVPPTSPVLTTPTPHASPTPASPSPSQTIVYASQSQQPPHPHRVPRQPPRPNKDDHMTTDTKQGHRPSSKVIEISSYCRST